MRGPAKLANPPDLQNFRERRFKAFEKMTNSEVFVETTAHCEWGHHGATMRRRRTTVFTRRFALLK
jgi:hypothetical protein